MQSPYIGNTTDTALRITQKLYPNETDFEVIKDGQENLVIVVGQTYSVRFPRTKEIWQRGLAERNVLKKLSSLSLPIPKILSISENPAYIQTTYLKGSHLDVHKIRNAPIATQQQVGREMAHFAYTLHTNLSIETIAPLLIPPTWSYDNYLKRVLFDRTDPDPQINTLAKHYYNAWLNKKPSSSKVIVHDDLHTGNLLFDDANHLVGVLDFGAICIGTAEQELRQTYRLSNEIFETAVSTYEQLSGKTLNRETAKLWVVTQELASYCRDDTEAVHGRALDNLRYWFPEIAH